MSPMPLVLSYPRSGLNWMRHCVEVMSGLRTPGHHEVGVAETGDYAFCRLHHINRGQRKVMPSGATWNSVCLILRDYRENYVRTRASQRSPFTIFKERHFASYAKNIQYFDAYEGAKLLLRYESHVKGFDDAIQFLNWAEISHTPLDPSQYRAEASRSSQRYKKVTDNYYQRVIDREITPLVEAASQHMLLKILGPQLFAKYLGCYDQSEQTFARAA